MRQPFLARSFPAAKNVASAKSNTPHLHEHQLYKHVPLVRPSVLLCPRDIGPHNGITHAGTNIHH
jgi:hypothetical protein